MTLRDSEYLACMILDCIRMQARGQRDDAEKLYWRIAGILGEAEAKRRLEQVKLNPDQRPR